VADEKLVKLMKRLAKYPHLEARIEALLDVAENSSGKLDRADDAEEKLIVEIKKIGNELLTTWATNQEEKSIRLSYRKSRTQSYIQKKT
jgi:hypothetical protein